MAQRDQPTSVETQLADALEQIRRLNRQVSGIPRAAATLNMRTVRGDTGAVAASATANVTVSWDEAFPDLAYVVSVVLESTEHPGLVILRVTSRTTTSVTLRIQNNATTPKAATIHVLAVHDVPTVP